MLADSLVPLTVSAIASTRTKIIEKKQVRPEPALARRELPSSSPAPPPMTPHAATTPTWLASRLTPASCHASLSTLQMQDFMKLYSGLVERCFNSCVTDFTSKVLTGKEVRSSFVYSQSQAQGKGLGGKADALSFSPFTRMSRRSSQATCVANCSDKFLKHSERVGARFAEHNAGAPYLPRFAGAAMSYRPLPCARADRSLDPTCWPAAQMQPPQ